MKMNRLIYSLTLTLIAIGGAEAQSHSGSAVPVTVENFIRAESDSYFVGFVNRAQECLFPVMRPSGISAYYLCLADRR